MDLRKDIYFFADLASFPTTGSLSVLYIDKSTGLIYTWSGSSYNASGAGGLNYLGLWDANANSPAIASGVGSTGDYYIVGTAGTTSIDGISDWAVNDWIIFGGAAWQKIDNSESPVPNLSDLGGVDITTTPLGDGEVLTYDGVSGLWKNEPPNSTPTNQVVLFADLATTEALKACTYSNGTLGVGATLTGNVNGQLSTVSFTDRIDNVVTALNQIILVKNQSSQTQNGIYVVTQLGSPTQPFIITRTTDADTQAELYPLQVNVFGGTTLANLAFLQKTVDPVVGTNNIVFTTTVLGIQNTPVLHVDTVTSAALPACTYTSGANPTLPGSGAFLEANVNGSIGTINGFALTNGRRVLIKDQANQAHNGVYVVSSAGSASTRWRLTRVDAWGANFTVLDREWKVNNPASTKYGARYSTNLLSLASTAIGTTNIVFSEAAAGGLTNFTEAANSSAPNATVPVNSLTATGAATNIDVAIVPKGTGAFMLDIPDNTAAGGNKRGANAVDLQTDRSNANQVASGQWSFAAGRSNRASVDYAIALGVETVTTGGLGALSVGYGSSATATNSLSLGYYNTAGASASVALGYNNTAIGANSFAVGQQNVASGAQSVAMGNTNVANADNSMATGYYSHTFGLRGRWVTGQVNSVPGDCQKSIFCLSIRTTGNTATTLVSGFGAGSPSATNQVILSNNSAYRFKGSIVGKQSGSTNVAAWDVDGLIVRGANAAATTLNISNVTLVQNTPAWGTPTLAADTTNGGLQVQVTGATATNIQWTAVIETTEVIYA